MSGKPVIPSRMAARDVENEVDHYLVDEGSEDAALGFIAEIEKAYGRLAKHPYLGSPRYAYELDIPGLRSWPLDHYPHLLFYIERQNHIEIWRVLNGKRDIPAWLSTDDGEFPQH